MIIIEKDIKRTKLLKVHLPSSMVRRITVMSRCFEGLRQDLTIVSHVCHKTKLVKANKNAHGMVEGRCRGGRPRVLVL